MCFKHIGVKRGRLPLRQNKPTQTSLLKDNSQHVWQGNHVGGMKLTSATVNKLCAPVEYVNVLSIVQ